MRDGKSQAQLNREEAHRRREDLETIEALTMALLAVLRAKRAEAEDAP